MSSKWGHTPSSVQWSSGFEHKISLRLKYREGFVHNIYCQSLKVTNSHGHRQA